MFQGPDHERQLAATAWPRVHPRPRPPLLAALLVVLAGCAAPAPAEDAASAEASEAAEPAAFVQRFLPDRAFEPTLGLGRGGVAFVTASHPVDLVVAGASHTDLWRTRDEGRTWEKVSPRLAQRDPAPFSFDPYVHVDATTGRVYVADLTLACVTLSWSDDDGDTWNVNHLGCGQGPHDHQTVFTGPPPAGVATVGYPSIVYVCTSNFFAGFGCARSLDGGLTFGPSVPLHVTPNVDARAFAPVCGEVLTGHGAASPLDGTVLVPQVACDVAHVYASRDGGLTWQAIVVDASAGMIRDAVDRHEASVAFDAAGNAYYYWLAADALPRLSMSVDRAATWTPPRAVAAQDVVAARYPAIAAHDAGRVAFLYVGHGGDEAWRAHVGYLLDALDAEAPVLTVLAHAADEPLQRGECAGRCGGIGDFLDIAADPETGRVWVALAGLCAATCEAQGGHAGGGMAGSVGIQRTGPTLRAT